MGRGRRDDSSGTSSSMDSSSGGSDSSSESGSERRRSKSRRHPKKSKDKAHKHSKHHKREHKKHHKREHKKHKKNKDHDRDNVVKAAKHFLKQQMAADGSRDSQAAPAARLPDEPPKLIPDSQRITDDDYFVKSTEFMAYLNEFRGVLFNELSTDEAHSLFSVFVDTWNEGRLPATYYAGMVTAPARRTAHVWGFAKGGSSRGARAGGMAAFLDDQKAREDERRVEGKADRKRRAAEHRELLNELVPKATGREGALQEKMARRDEARARDASPDRAFLPGGGGGDIMGGDDSFAAAKAREAQRAEVQHNRRLAKREDVMSRVAAHQAKEEEKMAQFRALLGDGPITIAKRS